MARDDFNGDGRSDVLWTQRLSGVDYDVTNWLGTADGRLISNDAIARQALGAFHTLRYQVTGDFNGDGRAEVMWDVDGDGFSTGFTTATGALRIFTGSSDSLWFVRTGSFRPVATGDFNGDGADDILWRSADGTLGRWNGSRDAIGMQTVTALAAIPLDWTIAGTGDFDGDGRSDILWRHSSGVVGTWSGTAGGRFQINDGTLHRASLDWHIAGIGDFNGDGRDDILWRHESGAVGTWSAARSNAFVVNDGAALIRVTQDWDIRAVGDYNGDGRDDILWRHERGAIGNWLADAAGGFTVNRASITSAPLDWQIQPNPSGAGDWDY